jgi:leucyl/phenylalanyl-tRNA--protein transferase
VIAAAVEPPPTPWQFPAPAGAPDDLVCLGADLEPGTILAAYRAGLFPMPYDRRRLGWWSPDPRGLLPLDRLRVTRSLRRSARRFDVRINTAFVDVVTACATIRRRGGWITPAFITAYARLHELGWTHSVETWTDDGELAGGLYGVAIGGFFAGESMFHRRTDASKVALLALVDQLRASGMTLLDVQWLTPHLATLGATEVPRARYLALLHDALAAPTTFRTQFAHG